MKIAAPAHLIVLLLAAGAARAQDVFDVPQERGKFHVAGHGLLAGFENKAVSFREPGDGRIWAVGDTYKASFGIEGATYIPFFGSRAPVSHPIAFRFTALRAGGDAIAFDADVMPVREGNRIVFDRGSFMEVYDLAIDSIEQSFVFADRLSGAIELSIATECDLARSSDDLGLVLSAEEGSVRYGNAFAVDARATRTALASAWQGSTIKIDVPAERVAAAAWPLVVDPLITTFDVDDSTTVDGSASVAYESSFFRWIVVYQRDVSGNDSDVVYRLLSYTGAEVAWGYIDPTSTRWGNPAVANNNAADQFMCVAEYGLIGVREIATGFVSAATGAMGFTHIVSSGVAGDKRAPDVGGDPKPTGTTYYCAVWQRAVSSGDHDINARLITTTGQETGVLIPLSSSLGTLDQNPAISKSCGSFGGGLGQWWNVVWHRFEAIGDNDIMGAQIGSTGPVLGGAFYIDNGPNNTYGATVSSPTADSSRTYMVTAMWQAGAVTTTYGWAMRGMNIVDSGVLKAWTGAPGTENQYSPSVDCDGSVFVVAEQETVSLTEAFNVYASTFHVIGDQLQLAEGHITIAGGFRPDIEPDVACAGASAGNPRRTCIAWESLTLDHVGDVRGAIYDANPFGQFCDPGQDGVGACPCGNAPSGPHRGCNNSQNTGGARLTAVGDVFADTVVLTASGMLPSTQCLFVQGTTVIPAGAVFGDGIRCVGGTFIRLGIETAVAGTARYPGPGDPSISGGATQMGPPLPQGADRYYFAYYRDAAAFACTTTFNTTNALRIRW